MRHANFSTRLRGRGGRSRNGPVPGSFGQQGQAAPPDTVTSSVGELRIQRLATLEFPWAIAMLPDGRLLITEKPGRLRTWDDGRLSEPIRGVPRVVHRGPEDQGGLLDVEVDPDFEHNGFIYLSFAEAAEQQSSELAETDDFRLNPLDMSDNIIRGGAVARARLEDGELRDLRVIWRQTPKTQECRVLVEVRGRPRVNDEFHAQPAFFDRRERFPSLACRRSQ